MNKISVLSNAKCIHVVLFFFFRFEAFAQISKIKELEKEIEYCKTDSSKVKILNEIGYYYLPIDPSKSIIKGKHAIELSNKRNNLEGIAKANQNIGIAYLYQGNYYNALKSFFEANRIYKSIDNKEGLIFSTLNIGIVYGALKEYKKSDELLKKSVAGFSSLGLLEEKAFTYTKIAFNLLNSNKKDQALEYLVEAFDIYKNENDEAGIAKVRYYLALLYVKENNFTKALSHVNKSILINEINNNNYLYVKNILLKGKISRLQKNYNASEKELLLGLKLAKDYHFMIEELFAFDELKSLSLLINNLENILLYTNSYVNLREDLFSYNKMKNISLIELENKTKEKEFLINASIGDDKDIKYIIIFLVFLVVLILFFSLKRKNGVIKSLKKDKLLQSKESSNDLLEVKKLREELVFKNKQIASCYLNFKEKDEVINNISKVVNDLKEAKSAVLTKKLQSQLVDIVRENIQIDKKWGDLKLFLEETQSNFYAKLKLKHPDLKTGDLKLCRALKLNLSIKETADILNISPGSLKTAKYRLRKKMNLLKEQELTSYLLKIDLHK